MSFLGGGNILGSVSLLDVASRTRVPGIGLSSRSRALTQQFLGQAQAGGSSIFSAGVSEGVDQLRSQILAIRAKVPKSLLGDKLAFSEPATGKSVDKSV